MSAGLPVWDYEPTGAGYRVFNRLQGSNPQIASQVTAICYAQDDAFKIVEALNALEAVNTLVRKRGKAIAAAQEKLEGTKE